MTSTVKLQKAIDKATDAGLRADNWGYLIEVCDLVKLDAEENGEFAMNLIEDNLLGRNANVILRTLSLVVALAENCGSRLQQAISSKHFTGILFKLVDDSRVHITVKREVVKTVHQLADSFKNDPSLKYMHDLENKIKITHPQLLSEPRVPKKKEMSRDKEQEEEKELAEALRLSLLEFEKSNGKPNGSGAAPINNGAYQPQQQQQQPEQQQQQQPEQQQPKQTPTTIRKVRAMYDFKATEQDELSFKKGDLICVVEQVYRDWWRGTLGGRVGIFPLNYVTPVTEPTKQELELEARKEGEVFAQKDNVDKLQRKLREAGNADVSQDQEINELYGSVSPLRPQISKMLGKYSQKKDDLLSLRQVLANAEITYNQLLSRASNAYAAPAPPPTSQYALPGYSMSASSQQPVQPPVQSPAPIQQQQQQQQQQPIQQQPIQQQQQYSYAHQQQVPVQPMGRPTGQTAVEPQQYSRQSFAFPQMPSQGYPQAQVSPQQNLPYPQATSPVQQNHQQVPQYYNINSTGTLPN